MKEDNPVQTCSREIISSVYDSVLLSDLTYRSSFKRIDFLLNKHTLSVYFQCYNGSFICYNGAFQCLHCVFPS